MLLKQGIILSNMLLVGAILVGCSGHQTGVLSNHHNHYQYSDFNINLSDDASNNCSDMGGVPALTKQLNGRYIPVCQLANGRRCNEQALLDGEGGIPRCLSFNQR